MPRAQQPRQPPRQRPCRCSPAPHSPLDEDRHRDECCDGEPLDAESLAKSYGGTPRRQNVHLSVRSGEVVGLLGPNGAGKTTSFTMIVGLSGQTPA